MVPDLECSTPSGGEVDGFQLCDVDHGNGNGKGNGNGNDNHIHNHTGNLALPTRLPATKMGSLGTNVNHLPPQDIGINLNLNIPTSPKQLPLSSSVGFWSPLKEIRLSSFYKLHCVPSLTVMAEPDQPGTHTIKLSNSEPLIRAEPQDKSLQNSAHNKLLEQVVRTPGRQPSPQPTHLGVPGPSHHRVLHEEGSGYVAPKFEGKEQQMDEGMLLVNILINHCSNSELTRMSSYSHGPNRGKGVYPT